eukprot:COSAG01_NODE_6449_length_3661_cov_3.663953_5_plen_87_part_00
MSCNNTPPLCALVSLLNTIAVLPHCCTVLRRRPKCSRGALRCHPGPKFHNKTAGAFVWGAWSPCRFCSEAVFDHTESGLETYATYK